MSIGVGGAIAVGVGALAVGTAASVYGSIKQGQAQSASNTFNAQQATASQTFTEQMTGREVTAEQQQEARQLGSVRAAYGASGVKMNGSANDVMESQANLLNTRIQNIQLRGGFAAQQYGAESQAFLSGAANASNMGAINAVASGFNGIGRMGTLAGFGGGGGNIPDTNQAVEV